MTARAARARPRQGGFTLVELLLTTVAMGIAVAAGLGAFGAFGRSTAENGRLTAAQDAARTAIDRVVRDLRNAAPTSATTTAVQRNGAYDLVFLTDRPGYGAAAGAARLVRYCVAAAGASTGRLVVQIGAAGQTALPGSACPDASWAGESPIAEDVANVAAATPLWTYDSATAASVRRVGVHLLIDDDAARRPPPVRIESGVYLRNRSLSPPAVSSGDFGASCNGSGKALLTAAVSVDASGDPLTTTFADNGVTVGSGGSLSHRLTAGTHQLTLTVTNVLGLSTMLQKTLSCP